MRMAVEMDMVGDIIRILRILLAQQVETQYQQVQIPISGKLQLAILQIVLVGQ